MYNTDYYSDRLKPVFARYLKEYRKDNNLTQEELAMQLMTTVHELHNVECEKALPDEVSFIMFLSLLKKEKLTAFIREMRKKNDAE